MPENIILKKSVTGGGETTVVVQVIDEKDLPIGGAEGGKRLLSVQIHRRLREFLTAQYFVKEFLPNPHMNLKVIKEVCLAYRVLFKKRYPVPETARYFIRDGKVTLVLSDMTEGGKYYVWGINDKPTSEDEKTFAEMNISQEDLISIRRQLRDLSAKASEDNIRLVDYNYQLKKHKMTGEIKVILLDLDKYTLRHTIGDVNDFNNRYVELFLEILEENLVKLKAKYSTGI